MGVSVVVPALCLLLLLQVRHRHTGKATKGKVQDIRKQGAEAAMSTPLLTKPVDMRWGYPLGRQWMYLRLSSSESHSCDTVNHCTISFLAVGT